MRAHVIYMGVFLQFLLLDCFLLFFQHFLNLFEGLLIIAVRPRHQKFDQYRKNERYGA